jgi:hypothetical protein
MASVLTYILYELSHQNPAFRPAQTRELTDIFVRKSIQVRNKLLFVLTNFVLTYQFSCVIFGLKSVLNKEPKAA